MSKFANLFDAIGKTSADEMRLVVGEKIHILRKGHRQDVGKEPLKASNMEPLALELLLPEELRMLRDEPRQVRREHAGTAFILEVVRGPEGISITIRPEGGSAPSEMPPVFGAVSAGRPAPAPARFGGPPGAVLTGAGSPPPLGARPVPAGPPDSARIEIDGPRVRPPTASETRLPESGRIEIADEETIGRGGAATAAASAALAEPKPTFTVTHPIDEMLGDMIARKASDLHVSSEEHPVLRIHGEVHFLRERPALSSDEIMRLLRPIFSEKALKDFEAKNDADFAYEVKGLARFRVNVFRDRKGVGFVMRQIPIDIIPADKLGLPKAVLDLCYLSKGLVVVTGPTGSGKSTTLASMIDYINKNRSDHIITIEDPVEFVHPNIKCLVNQREVGQHTGSFKNALRAALREDPDIVLVGEMRDLETISIAIETAETGHLVFGTLHTTTAMSTVDRIIDQFPPDQQQQIRVMLSESLRGVVAQVLCKKAGGGRAAALEVLIVNHAVSSLIRDAKTFQIPSVMQTSKRLGMRTMNDSLLELVSNKTVTAEDAYVKAVDKAGLANMFRNANIPCKLVNATPEGG